MAFILLSIVSKPLSLWAGITHMPFSVAAIVSDYIELQLSVISVLAV